MERKKLRAKDVLSWIRPKGMVKIAWEKRKWLPEEDAIVLRPSVDEAAERLNRTPQSIRMRRWRLGRCDGVV